MTRRRRMGTRRKSMVGLCGVFLIAGALVQREDSLLGARRPGLLQQRDEAALTKQQNDADESDPCDHQPAGKAFGWNRQCPPRGSSAGVAKGDFNGDGFADLAIGVPL